MSPPLLVSVPQKGNTEARPQDLEFGCDSGVTCKKARAPHRIVAVRWRADPSVQSASPSLILGGGDKFKYQSFPTLLSGAKE
jgi:hypothetical protein